MSFFKALALSLAGFHPNPQVKRTFWNCTSKANLKKRGNRRQSGSDCKARCFVKTADWGRPIALKVTSHGRIALQQVM
jgi:hypothetical protein